MGLLANLKLRRKLLIAMSPLAVMRYAGAGHPPVLQWRNSTGKTAKLLENGLVLGMVAEATYDALEFPLELGDRYVLYTDGVLEATNSAREEFGADRFMRFIENHKHLVADQFSETLLTELSRWSNQTSEPGQQDDITLLVIDFKHHRGWFAGRTESSCGPRVRNWSIT